MLVFDHAFLQELGCGKLGPEETLLKAELDRQGIPVALFTKKRIQRRQLPLTTRTFLAGDVESIKGALKQLGREAPPPNDYPTCLQGYLKRHVWQGVLGDIKRRVYDGDGGAVFVKPAERTKAFTGRLLESPDDFQLLGGAGLGMKVWCSEPVEWISEYRAYVIRGRVGSVAWYRGDKSVLVDRAVLESAVRDYETSGTAPSAYAIDFGVLSNGETALVEVNDGFSVGAYDGVSGGDYAEMVMTRWRELMGRLGPAYHEVAKAHLAQFFAGHPSTREKWEVGPMAGDTGFSVLRFDPGPKDRCFVYCTVGASASDPNLPAVEFFLLSPQLDTMLVQRLTMAAYYHRTEILNLHHTFPIGEPWLEGASCDCFFVSLPYTFGPELELLEHEGVVTHFFWLLPVTAAERKFAREEGAEALEQRFEVAGLEYWDLKRKSVV